MKNQYGEKAVVYYCPGCRKRITRWVPRAYAFYESECATAGRVVRMRKLKNQSAG